MLREFLVWACLMASTAFLSPLRLVYFHGPQFRGVGFWEGADPAEICSQITDGVPASHWLGTGKQECDQLL